MSPEEPAAASKSFWTTFPGIASAVAALLTAVVAAVSLFIQARSDDAKEPSNRPPTASNDTQCSAVSSSRFVANLDNDFDPDGDEISIVHVTNSERGGQTVVRRGADLQAGNRLRDRPWVVEYIPPRGATPGTEDSYEYSIADGRGGSAQARATIRLEGSDEECDRGPGQGRDGTAGPAGAPVPGLGAEEQRLASLIPNEAVRVSCRPVTDGADSTGELAEVVCTFDGGTVYYQSYSTSEQARDAWAKSPLPPDAGQPTGCDESSFWYEGDYRDPSRNYEGKLRCFVETSGRAVIVWTDDSQRVLGMAIRSDGNSDRLVATWQDLGPTG